MLEICGEGRDCTEGKTRLCCPYPSIRDSMRAPNTVPKEKPRAHTLRPDPDVVRVLDSSHAGEERNVPRPIQRRRGTPKVAVPVFHDRVAVSIHRNLRSALKNSGICVRIYLTRVGSTPGMLVFFI